MLYLQKGQVLLSRFAVLELLGEGGMGQVWQVRDLELQVHIAIKVLNPLLSALPERVELLKNECRNTRRLVHPNIVRVFDFHRAEDLIFISMEYIAGEDLVAYHRRLGLLSHLEVVSLLQPLVAALSYAHDLGLVHRDLKAGNILLDQQQSPRLTDFGIAGVFKSGENSLKITSGGSLYCMSPQQLDGHQPQPADDIYAFGTLMYELLTGNPPFYPDITTEKIRHKIPPPVNQQLAYLNAGANIPSQLEELIVRMLAKAPDGRPANMQEINQTLQAISAGTAVQTLPPVVPVQTPPQNRPLPPEAEIITPAEVSLQDKKTYGSYDRKQNLIYVSMLVFVFLLMLIGGVWLLYYLSNHPIEAVKIEEPGFKPQPPAPKKKIELPEGQPSEISDPEKLALEKKNAEQKLAEFIRLKNELDHKGASVWAEEDYAEMVLLSRTADAYLVDQAYPSASEAYAKAIEQANKLAGQVPGILQRLLEQGRQALDQANGQQAQEKFSLALLIDPANESARRALERAKTIDTVMNLLQSGKQHEKNNKLAFARADYQEALRLDSELKEAHLSLQRVEELIKNQEYQQLISDGLAAFHNNDYEQARSKLLKAKSFKPDSREVQDALAQVDGAMRLARIANLRQTAQAAEQSEDWEQALIAYLEVLKLDATIQFASQGKQRCLDRIRIARRLNFFLEKPEILASDSQLQNAVSLIHEANMIEPQGSRLSTQLNHLTQLVKDAQTPVKVTIESDNLTDVAVYKVGKLGRFSVMELNLRPGTYTVVGAREGYKDVRQQIVVKSGQQPLRISVKCGAKI